jgi:YfiH family protein
MSEITPQPLAQMPGPWVDHQHGRLCESSDVVAFFGRKTSNPNELARSFPQLTFSFLRQTHSKIVLCADGVGPSWGGELGREGDAQWSQTPGLAIGVRTADCVPILLYDRGTRAVAAIHAGWRGVENQIVLETLLRLQQAGSFSGNATDLIAFIGPHIEAQSLEVGPDVADRLEQSYRTVLHHDWPGFPATALLAPGQPGQKFRVDLLTIVKAQLRSKGYLTANIIVDSIDTFCSPQHESFRRDGARSGRQLSFIALKPPKQ